MADIQQIRDEELVVIVREKDQELYTEIVKRYEEKLRRYALVFVHDTDKADDVLQNTFLKAFINLKSFNTKKKFSSWIYRILHNEAINYIKKHKKEVSIDEAPEIQDMASENDSPIDELEAREMKNMLLSKIDKLPLKYSEPLMLFYMEERSYEEISDILRMPIGTVGTRINRGKSLLKKTIKKEYESGQQTAS